jgi:sugar phosphate isomerase/epimerase
MMNQLLFGMPTLIERPGIRESVKLCTELGLDFIELNMNLPQYQIGIMDADELRKSATANGIFLTIHLDENLNICDFNNRVADAYRHTVFGTIDLAKRMDVDILNMHMAPGIWFTLPDKRVYLFDLYKDRYLEKLKLFRDQCEKAIGGSGIRICVENSGGYHAYLQDGVEMLLESQVFALTWDVGHDQAIQNSDSAFINSHASRVAHMHIHDAIGSSNHLVLGSGEVDLADRIRFAKEHGCRCVIETKSVDGLKASVSFLKTMLGQAG